MLRKLEEVDKIMDAKNEVACGRDYLQNMLRYLKAKIARLEGVYKRKHRKYLKTRIKSFRAITRAISESIEAANALLETSGNCKVLKAFREIFSEFVNKIRNLQKLSNVFAHKFREIYSICTEMVLSAIELKKIVSTS